MQLIERFWIGYRSP